MPAFLFINSLDDLFLVVRLLGILCVSGPLAAVIRLAIALNLDYTNELHEVH